MHQLDEPASHPAAPAARAAAGAPQYLRARALALAAAALVALASLGALVQSGAVASTDLAVQRLALAAQSPALHAAALVVTIAGGITAMHVIALGSAAAVGQRIGWRVAALFAAAPFVAELWCDLAKRAYAQPRPAGLGHGVDATFAFPSAHAAVSAATCGTVAWICWREGIIDRPVAMLVALAVPMLVGISRVLLNVHWASDVAGGWCTGVAVAGCAAALHARGRIA